MMSLLACVCVAQTTPSVELHGYMQNRFYAPPSASSRFVSERLSLSAVGKLTPDINAYAELYFHPWITDSVLAAQQFRTYLESAYVDLPLGPGRVRVGKGRQLNFGLTPSYPNRKTSQYGIISETYTQDRIVGAQWSMKKGTVDGGLSLFTDQNLSTRGEGDFAGAIPNVDTVPHLVDKDIPGSISGELAVSGRFGFTTPRWQGHVSAMTGQYSATQLGTINTAFATPTNTNTDHNKFGVDTIYSAGNFVAQGEWYTGNFSFLGITGYQVLVGYQPKDKDRWYVRWAALNNDVAPIVGTPTTYNTQQLTFAYVHPISRGVWIELDYERNLESVPTGGASIDNDLFFVELFTGF